MLNNIAHKDLRVIQRYGAKFGDNAGTVLVFPTEFEDVQREYPIFFRKDPATGDYQSVALLGFEKSENLFLREERWDAKYIPGVIARGPFLIGFQADSEGRTNPVIHVDLDHPRISESEGEPIFMPKGGNSPYLDHVATVLGGIREGLEISKAMFAAFTEADLIETVQLEVKPTADKSYSLTGLLTINQQKLAALNGAALEKLNSAGFLRGAFLVTASMNNVKRLMALKRQRAAAVAG
jgi:hypothetical protein